MNQRPLIVNSAIAQNLQDVGDRWTLLILRDAFLGVSRFEDFRRHSGISKATLTRRLAALTAGNILCKRAYATGRFDYTLSSRGKNLFASSLLAWQWELQWCTDHPLPDTLRHTTCGHRLQPQAVCAHCQKDIQLQDVTLPDYAQPAQPHEDEQTPSSGPRRARSEPQSAGATRNLVNVSDLLGDRWTLLTLICAFFGATRYDAFQQQLNIASNILTNRLNLLVAEQVFQRRQYHAKPPRLEYRLTTKGQSLFSIVMSLRQWARDALPPGDALEPVHQPCGQPLTIQVRCGHCQHTLRPRDVTASA